MNINLYTNFYLENNGRRLNELLTCLKLNLANELINRIFIYIESDALKFLELNISNWEKLVILNVDNRPTFNDYFHETLKYPDDINIIANADIYFDDTLKHLTTDFFGNNICFALSRWDKNLVLNRIDPVYEIKHYNESRSQDAWIFFGAAKLIDNADFSAGILGCDNSLAYLLKESGFIVYNPSRNVKAIHFHVTNIRNYVRDVDSLDFKRVSEPYLFLDPIELKDIKLK